MDRSGDAARPARLAGIEGARAIAATSIVVYHTWLYAAPGAREADVGPLAKLFSNLQAGVTLFFVLSGFLLFRPYAAAVLRGRPAPSVLGYLRNRALRILPAYWVVLAVVALVAHRELLRAPRQLLANAFFAQDYVPRYMPAYNGGAGIVPAWSLAVEVVFYLCLPVLGALALRRSRGGGSVSAAAAPVALLAVLGFASKALVRMLGLGLVWQSAFPVHADWFAAGMALAVLRVLWEDGRLPIRPGARKGAVVAAAALALAAVALERQGTLSPLEYQTPIALACALLLGVVVLGSSRRRFVRILESRLLTTVGLWSYSLFLWHDPLLRWLRANGLMLAGRGGFAANLVVVLLLSLVASAATYYVVERPALSLKRPWQRTEAPRERAADARGPVDVEPHAAAVGTAAADASV